MYRKRNNQIYKTVVVIWLTLSIASVILAAVTWIDLSRKLRLSREAVSTQNQLDSIMALLLDAETSQRGFTITGLGPFLAPFTIAESQLPSHFDSLAELAREDSKMLRSVMHLRGQAELAMDHHRNVIQTRRTEGGEAAAAIVATSSGKRIMDDIRKEITQLRSMRSDLISDNGSGARAQLMRASLTSLIAGIIGIGTGVYAFWLARIMLGHEERERQLVEEKLRAERSSQEKAVFLANMSHEIRTPMNAILGFSELLASELHDPQQSHYLKAIRTSAGSLLQLINDILDMSKIEAGVMELAPEPTDPREICDFLHTVFSEPAAKKSVKLECKVAEDLPRALLMDRIRLRQVLVNLVGNAVKFTDKGGIEVRVQWQKQDTSSQITLLIEVQDTGLGIPPDKLETIFKPFVQAGAHREKEKSGTGLGLSIVRRLTEMMGGTVTAASVLGQGSAFSLRFPDVAVSSRIANSEKLDVGSDTNFNLLRPIRMLVVDDNETNCHLVSGMFQGTHHELDFAHSGAEAIQKATLSHPDIILMDIRMPGMDGREALEKIRTLKGLDLTPIIAVTASSLKREEGELRSRFNGYVRKPFSKRELFTELAQFLPRIPDRNPTPPGSPYPPASTAKPAPQALIQELRSLLSQSWPQIRDSLAINDTKQFADQLRQLSQHHRSPTLERFAENLKRNADLYEFVELEKLIVTFPSLIDQLEQGAAT